MADNLTVTPGTGATVGADEIDSVKYQRIKLIHGADNVNDGDVSNSNPFPSKITDGTRVASVRNTGSNNSLNVAIVDGSGNQVTSFGGVTQYSDGAAAATPTGVSVNWNEAGTQRTVSASKPLPVDIKNASVPVTGTFWQATQPVSGTVSSTQSGTWSVRNQDGAGNSLASSNAAPLGTEQALIVRNIPSGTQPVSGTVTANAGTGNFSVNNAQVAGGTISTVATGVQKVGVSDSAGNSFLSAANALNSTGTGIQAVQTVAQFDDTTPTTITENQFGNLRMSANRNLYVTLRDAAGSERGLNIDSSNRITVVVGQMSSLVAGTALIGSVAGADAHDAAAAQNPATIAGVANSGEPAAVSANGDVTRLWADTRGALQVQSVPGTARGCTAYKLISAATTNANSVKASAGQVYGWAIFNSGASKAYVKIYNKASAPAVGTDTPELTLMVPADGGLNLDIKHGISFATGIAIAITGGMTDADTTAVAANQIALNLWYK